MTRSWLVLALALACTNARAQFSSTTLHGVDSYRSEQASADQIKVKLGPLLNSYARMRYDRRPKQAKELARLREQIMTKVRSMGRFAYADVYYGEYATSADRSIYLTFDLVDAEDAKTRMPFRPAPQGQPADPAGLIAAWRQYDAIGNALMSQGAISMADRPNCPGFYCKWGSSTRDLATLEQRISQGAESKKADLKKVAMEDADPSHRAAALYVLSYIHDGGEASRIAADGLTDPAPEPRAAALSILSDMVSYHKEVLVDIGRLVAALDYPTVLDRSKALGLLVSVADSDSYRPYLRTRATPMLMPLLRLDQPNNHDLAFTLLSVLSGEAYGPRDYDAWQNWIDHQSAPAPQPDAGKKNGR